MNLLAKTLRALFACTLLASAAFAADETPYIGEWSNGRGETLVITTKTICFANDKPVPYRDLTRATDGKSFTLEITAPGEVNAFAEKFLAVQFEDDDEMQIVGYKSLADLSQDKNPGSKVIWYKDDDSPD